MTMIGPTRIRLAAGIASIAMLCAGAATALAFDSGKEQRNFSKTHDRCGPGTDRAKVDARDRVRGCERVREKR